MVKTVVKVIRTHSDAKIPEYAHEGDHGDLAADLYSVEDGVIGPGQTVVVSLGLRMEFPSDFGAKIEGRSGLASKGVFPVGGVIDPGYRGEMGVILHNSSGHSYSFKSGERIGQLRIVERIEALFEETSYTKNTPRGISGFGSTGK